MTESKQTTSKQTTSKQTKYPTNYWVVECSDTIMDNFPSSLEACQKEVENFIWENFKHGYVYSGTLTRNVNGIERNFYVFYKWS